MSQSTDQKNFETTVLPHLDAGHNLARWLVRDPQDAEDIVQEALLRAMKYFSGFRGHDAKAWFLVIVRNACYAWFQRNRKHAAEPLRDDERGEPENPLSGPETTAQRDADRDQVRKAIAELPTEFREVIVLREIEGLSYKEIAEVASLPIGTVMSRLTRARARLQEALKELRSPS